MHIRVMLLSVMATIGSGTVEPFIISPIINPIIAARINRTVPSSEDAMPVYSTTFFSACDVNSEKVNPNVNVRKNAGSTIHQSESGSIFVAISIVNDAENAIPSIA